MPKGGLFILGTQLGVGSTALAAGLAAAFRARGRSVGVMKPFLGGWQDGGELTPELALLLAAAGTEETLDELAPVRLRSWLPPAVVEEREGIEVNIAALKRTLQQLHERHDFILVEGAGGLLVPLTSTFYLADLVRFLKLPVLVVAPDSWQSLNHILLTLAHAQCLGLHVIGFVLNQVSAAAPEAGVVSLSQWVEQLSGKPSWGVFPHLQDWEPSDEGIPVLLEAVEKTLDMDRLCRVCCGEEGG